MRNGSALSKRGLLSLGLVVAIVISILGSVTAATAVPAAPGGLAPNSSSPAVAANPILSWSRVNGAVSYEVEVSTASSFTSTVYKTSTTNRRAVPTQQLPVGVIWWRVRSLDSARVAGPWAVASFTRSTIAGPTLASPTDGATLRQPDSPPLLRWNPVDGATSYQVEIDGAERDWVETTTYSTSTTSFVVPNPQENGNYWWRVRAQLGSGINTLSSSEWSYNVGPLPVVGPVNLEEPDLVTRPFEDQVLDGAYSRNHPACIEGTETECFGDIVFDWEPVDGAVSYDIRVSTDDSFDSVIDQRVVKGTRYSPIPTYDNDDYWWQVRARDIFGKAQEWNEVRIRQFRREWSPAPTAIHPAASDPLVSSDDFYFEWSPVRLATRYRLDVGTDVNFSPTTYESCFTTQTTFASGYVAGQPWPNLLPDRCMPTPGVTHYWRVKALDGPRAPEVQGIYSEPVRFIYDPGQVEQLMPLSGTTVDVPTLSWKPARDAVKYKVIINGGVMPIAKEVHSYSWTPTGRTKLDPTKGPYSWTVQSIDRNGDVSPLPLFSSRTFSLSGNLPSSGAAPLQPLSPARNSAFARFPALTWEPHPDAAYYRVHVGDAGTGYFSELSSNGYTADDFPYPAATDASSTHLRPGRYDWLVAAYTSTGVPLGNGPTSTFEVTDLPAVSGHRAALDASGLAGTPCDAIYPAKCEFKGTPLLDWDPVPDAGYYMVYLSRDQQFTNMVIGNYSEPLTIPATQNTRWNPVTALADSQAGTAYYWYIRPCKAPGVCAPDPLQANHAFEKRSNKVDQLQIADPLTERIDTFANELTFTWRDYLATNQDPSLKNPVTSEQSGQAARGYRVQVGTTAAFPTPLVDEVVVDQTTYTAFSRTYPEGQLFWRVQAVDGSGNGLAWSEVKEFTKESPTVKLTDQVRPRDLQSARTDQAFRWDPLRFAASYDIEVYKNGDTAASSLNRVVSGNSKQVAYSATTLLPVSPEPYVWRVRRVDVDGKKGGWSDWWSFSVVGDSPTLVSPGASTSVAGNDLLFTWQAVKGAATYRFERKQAGLTYSAETVTTAAVAWAPTQTVASGDWQWRVTALDPANKPIASSAWRTFSVSSTATTQPPTDTTPPTVVKKTPLTYAKRGSNFTAKFSEPVKGVSGTTMRLFKGTTRVSAKVTLSADKKTATLNPSRLMKRRAKYTLKLSSGIRDLAGNRLKATSWTVRVR